MPPSSRALQLTDEQGVNIFSTDARICQSREYVRYSDIGQLAKPLAEHPDLGPAMSTTSKTERHHHEITSAAGFRQSLVSLQRRKARQVQQKVLG